MNGGKISLLGGAAIEFSLPAAEFKRQVLFIPG